MLDSQTRSPIGHRPVPGNTSSDERSAAVGQIFDVHWAEHESEMREAQRLRHRVFVEEMGARLEVPAGAPSGHDPEVPALIKGYLRRGARVLGPPAWDPAFGTADLPLLMRFADLPARYRKHFLER